MRKNLQSQTALEERLRQNVPPLRAPDLTRVSRACMRSVSAPPVSPLRKPHTFTQPLLRVAACLTLLAGVALLIRPKPLATTFPALPSAATFYELTTLMGTQSLENALACEAADLASDLADLTAVLNDRTLALLF
jgi:hypothetical protein